LTWAKAHHARAGRWPTTHDGPVVEAVGEKCAQLDKALRLGRRGLGGGTSLLRLLARKCRARPVRRSRLTSEQIAQWADTYWQSHGRWPTASSGPVAEVPGLSWLAIDMALRNGLRGLPA